LSLQLDLVTRTPCIWFGTTHPWSSLHYDRIFTIRSYPVFEKLRLQSQLHMSWNIFRTKTKPICIAWCDV